jgi:hypothetical protein
MVMVWFALGLFLLGLLVGLVATHSGPEWLRSVITLAFFACVLRAGLWDYLKKNKIVR